MYIARQDISAYNYDIGNGSLCAHASLKIGVGVLGTGDPVLRSMRIGIPSKSLNILAILLSY